MTMRWLRWISGIVWIFSWYTVYLEGHLDHVRSEVN